MMLWLRRRKDLHCSLASSCRAELRSLASWTLRNKGCLPVSNGEFRGTPEALWEKSSRQRQRVHGRQINLDFSGEFKESRRKIKTQKEFKTAVGSWRRYSEMFKPAVESSRH